MLALDREVRDLLEPSPELQAIYRDILNATPGGPSCDCLDRVQLQLVSRAQSGVAVLSLDGRSSNYRQGEGIGATACRVGTVAAEDVTVQCGTQSCVLRLGGPRDCSG